MRLGPNGGVVKRNLYSVKIVIYKAFMATTRPTNRATAVRAAPLKRKTVPKRPGKRAAGRKAGSGEDSPYHHGALRDALLKAAQTVLERDGWQGRPLRAGARQAGVSHAAPTHHFGDLTGLISELAAIGFR